MNKGDADKQQQPQRSETPDRSRFQCDSQKVTKEDDEDYGWDWSDLGKAEPVEGLMTLAAQENEAIKRNKIPDKRINYCADPEELQECPYEKSHLIQKKRFTSHLLKCRRQYEKQCAAARQQPSIVICSWSRNHHVPEDQIQKHEEDCPSHLKDPVPVWKPEPKPEVPCRSTQAPVYSYAPAFPRMAARFEEDWNDDLDKAAASGKPSTFDQLLTLQAQKEKKFTPFAQPPAQYTRAERRAFREQQGVFYEQELDKMVNPKPKEATPEPVDPTTVQHRPDDPAPPYARRVQREFQQD